jgi:hypothetical protein
MYADPVIAVSPISLSVDVDVAAELAALAGSRPLVVDFKVSCCRGVPVGDLTVEFGSDDLDPRYVEVQSVTGVRILIERHLVELLAEGARLHWHRGLLGRALGLSLVRPEQWFDFLDAHPSRR